MWPWAHWAVGYLAASALHRRRGERPDAVAALAVSLGTQLPDLVDKPLAWWLGALPNGRSLAHSAITAAVVLAVLLVVARRTRLQLHVRYVGLGWASHLLADATYPLAGGRIDELAFLLWPVLPSVQYRLEPSLWAHLATLSPSPRLAFELALFAAGLWVWWRDGAPGLHWLRAAIPWPHSRS